MSRAVSEGAGGVRVTGEMNIFSAAQLKQPLLDAVRKGRARKGQAKDPQQQRRDVAMDLSQVCEFDTAGLQLLLMVRHEARASGRGFAVTAASNVVRESLALCGATGLLADAPDAEAVL